MFMIHVTAKNSVISPNFLVCKFCVKTNFPHSFGQIAEKNAETVTFHKISAPGNKAKLRYFFLRCVPLVFPCLLGYYHSSSYSKYLIVESGFAVH